MGGPPGGAAPYKNLLCTPPPPPTPRMHVQSCCFVNLNLLLFCCSRSHYRRRCSSVVTRIRECFIWTELRKADLWRKKRAVSKVFTQIRIFLKPHTFFLLIGLRSAHTKPVPESAPRHRNHIFLKPLTRMDFSGLWSTEIRYILCVNYVDTSNIGQHVGQQPFVYLDTVLWTVPV